MNINKTAIFLSIILILLNFKTSAQEIYRDIENAVTSIYNSSSDNDFSFAESAGETATSSLLPQNILTYTTDCLKNVFSGSHPKMLAVFSIIMLSCLVQVFSKNLGNSANITDTVSLLSLILVCLNITAPLLISVTDYLEKHISFMMSVTSTTGVILASSGNVSGAAASSASSAFITAFTEVCAVYIILPAVKTVIILSCAGAISGFIDLSGIINFLKSFCTYGIGLIFSVFLGVHTLAVNIAANTDSIAFKSIRFTFARLIPVAGGMISESIRSVLAGINIIKSAAGGIGIAYIIYTAIPTVLSVILAKTVILSGIQLAKIFGVRKHLSFLEGLNGAYNLLFAICVFAAFGGIIVLAVFINTGLTV